MSFILKQPGWYQITNEEHHAQRAVSSSALKKFCESKKRFYHKYIARDAPSESYETKFLVGTCVHMMLLEPEKAKVLIDFTPHRANTKAYEKAVLDRFPDVDLDHADNSLGRFMTKSGEHVYMLSPSVYQMVQNMVKSANEHKLFRKLAEPCVAELSGFAKYRDTWLSCRGDLKSIPQEVGPVGYFLDIKSCATLSDYGLQYQIFSFAYHVQHLHYLNVANLIDGADSYKAFYFLFIEKEYPYETRLVHLDASDNEMQILYRHYKTRLDELIDNSLSGDFNEPAKQGVTRVRIPNWILEKFTS